MSAGKIFAVLLGLVVGVWLIFAAVNRHSMMPIPTPWEYCELGVETSGQMFDTKTRCYFAFQGNRIYGKDWANVATIAKIKIPEDAPNPRLEIMNHLGCDGWELVAYESSINPTVGGGIYSIDYQWVFKRPRP